MTPDELERATAKLLSQSIPEGPSSELTAATLHALSTTPPYDPSRSRSIRRSTVLKVVGYGSLVTAASVAIVFGVFFFGTPHRSAASEFEKAMDNASKAKTMKLEVVNTEENGAEGIKEMSRKRLFITEKAFRSEVLEVAEPGKPNPNPPIVLAAYVCQFESKKGIVIDYNKKTYRPGEVHHFNGALKFSTLLFDEIPEMKAKAKDAHVEKDEVINGKTFHVYSITLTKFFGLPLNVPARIWIDPQKKHPVKIISAKTNKPVQGSSNEPVRVVEDKNATKRITYRNIIENIVFDGEMDEELFSLTPKGFQEVKE
ncbi:MAG: hypothetical protein U0798_05105 [Gemmataceae bacterium]